MVDIDSVNSKMKLYLNLKSELENTQQQMDMLKAELDLELGALDIKEHYFKGIGSIKRIDQSFQERLDSTAVKAYCLSNQIDYNQFLKKTTVKAHLTIMSEDAMSARKQYMEKKKND